MFWVRGLIKEEARVLEKEELVGGLPQTDSINKIVKNKYIKH